VPFVVALLSTAALAEAALELRLVLHLCAPDELGISPT
jgi:hypothetical protein